MENNADKCVNYSLYEERFKNLEGRIEAANHRLDSYDTVKEVLVELKLITSQLVKSAERSDEVIREHTLILSETAKSLKDLAEKQVDHQEKLESLNVKIDHTNNKTKIDYLEVVNKFIYAGLGAWMAHILEQYL